MLAAEIDFYQIFRVHPTAMALMTPDLEFIDANDEFLAAAGHPLEELIGRNAFSVLPKMPLDPGGEPRWTALEEAQASGRRECLTLTRYDVEDPARPGVFQERYWSSSVTPVRGRDGHVEVLEFSAREVTSIITEFKKLQEQESQTRTPRPRGPAREKGGQVRRARPRVPAPAPPADNNPVPLTYGT